tara:strand:+ start:188 stop:382 length:195 start_codon:yes stop_codon:yes gene_type:complete
VTVAFPLTWLPAQEGSNPLNCYEHQCQRAGPAKGATANDQCVNRDLRYLEKSCSINRSLKKQNC